MQSPRPESSALALWMNSSPKDLLSKLLPHRASCAVGCWVPAWEEKRFWWRGKSTDFLRNGALVGVFRQIDMFHLISRQFSSGLRWLQISGLLLNNPAHPARTLRSKVPSRGSFQSSSRSWGKGQQVFTINTSTNNASSSGDSQIIEGAK